MACLFSQTRLSSGQDIFGPLIHKFLLNNTHKVGWTALSCLSAGSLLHIDRCLLPDEGADQSASPGPDAACVQALGAVQPSMRFLPALPSSWTTLKRKTAGFVQVAVELLPDTELAALVELREKDRLASAKADMTPEQVEAVVRETEELKLRQVGSCMLAMLWLSDSVHSSLV